MSAALNSPSSTPPEASKASQEFFEAIMSGELAGLSDEQVEALIASETTPPRRGVPHLIERTPEQQEAMVKWTREPLSKIFEESHV